MEDEGYLLMSDGWYIPATWNNIDFEVEEVGNERIYTFIYGQIKLNKAFRNPDSNSFLQITTI